MQYIQKANGATFTFEILNCDSTPMDLSAITVKFIVKKNKETPDANAILTGEYINSDTNELSFAFNATTTAALEAGYYIAALKLYRTSDMDEEIWQDDLEVIKGVFDA